jgi:hypothetical protein
MPFINRTRKLPASGIDAIIVRFPRRSKKAAAGRARLARRRRAMEKQQE